MRQFALQLCASIALAALAQILAQGPAAAATPPAPVFRAAPASQLAVTTLSGPRMIYFRNACDEPLETAVHYQATDGSWRMSRWIEIAPGDQRPVGRTEGEIYYSTARRLDGDAMPIRGDKVRALVYGDEAASVFGVRPLTGLAYGDVLQVFHCGEAVAPN